MMVDDVSIRIETALQDDLRAMVAELDAAMREQEPDTPEEFNFPMTAEQMAAADTVVWLARDGGRAVGCCALRLRGGGLGEIKRMYVHRSARGRGLAARLIATVEAEARERGLTRLALETGHLYHAARSVYERAGFMPCGPFADYPDSPYVAFYDKALVPVHSGPIDDTPDIEATR